MCHFSERSSRKAVEPCTERGSEKAARNRVERPAHFP
ncbi:hypothetical protein AB0D83_34485 [Streptomyces decoyicus]